MPWAKIKKTSSQFRDSGLVNSKIKVSDLRDPEIKQKSEHTCENGSVLKVGKAFLFRRQDFRVLRSRKEKESQLRFQVSKIENFLEGKKQGRLQHRLQLGIPLPCEAGRTVDQVPILGKWSHRLKSTEKFKEKDRKGGKSSLCTSEIFSNSDTLSKHS
jgi:hypothetical protein